MSDLGSSGPHAAVAFDPRRAPSAPKVVGDGPATADLLTHNPLNAVTGGIWRVTGPDRSAIAKLLTDGRDHSGPAGWAASTDRSHWNWWEREARVYGGAIPDRSAPDGVDGPALLAVDRLGDGRVMLWLEDVEGSMPTTIAELGDLARRLGRA